MGVVAGGSAADPIETINVVNVKNDYLLPAAATTMTVVPEPIIDESIKTTSEFNSMQLAPAPSFIHGGGGPALD
eukprot:CAMPEP_0170483742 /NCGR_PEP_ID=MMETSP0208-20121228/3362_1 /TAXON_ID=197538 /ORGANISM="Strombidium inclinatum, Strain S3" /LENGTH=73 /DNA_ID=CAMNT_0010756885 /DNA_START=1000 /DNA_END=1221 /DNA_ORIENTATION=+